MSHIPSAVILLECLLALTLIALLPYAWRRAGRIDALLWTLVWCTRTLASLNGSLRLEGESQVLSAYVGLQACSGLALIIMFLRSELRVSKLAKTLMFHIIGAGSSEQRVAGPPTMGEQRDERRREPRLTFGDEVRVPAMVTIVGQVKPPLRATVLNISSRGVRLLVDREVSPGTAVCIEAEHILLAGRVHYCNRQGSGFTIGLATEARPLAVQQPAEVPQFAADGINAEAYHQIQ